MLSSHPKDWTPFLLDLMKKSFLPCLVTSIHPPSLSMTPACNPALHTLDCWNKRGHYSHSNESASHSWKEVDLSFLCSKEHTCLATKVGTKKCFHTWNDLLWFNLQISSWVVLCSQCIIVKRAKANTLAGLSIRPYITASGVLVVLCIVGQPRVNSVQRGGEMPHRHLGRETLFLHVG